MTRRPCYYRSNFFRYLINIFFTIKKIWHIRCVSNNSNNYNFKQQIFHSKFKLIKLRLFFGLFIFQIKSVIDQNLKEIKLFFKWLHASILHLNDDQSATDMIRVNKFVFVIYKYKKKLSLSFLKYSFFI